MKKIIFFIILFSFFGCTNIKKKSDVEETKNIKIVKVVKSEKKETNNTKFMEVYDPLEPINRRIYYFNYYLDKYVLIPVVKTYEYVTPGFFQKGVSNFFSNLQEINTFINSLLQFEGRKATITLARFTINTTLGVFGLFDVASKLDLTKEYEDFGLTLAKYGVKNGPYLVLPALGPSNLRDGVGKLGGVMTMTKIDPYHEIGVDITSPAVIAADVINTRKKAKSFRYYGTGSPFEYEYVRFIYTEYRNTLKNSNDIK